MTDTPKVRQRVPFVSLAIILVICTMTFGGAAANMMPQHVLTTREIQRAEQDELAAARRDRIAELQKAGDQCRAQPARELARALFFDGRSAVAYADDYAARCGDDPIVRRWADASVKLHLHR